MLRSILVGAEGVILRPNWDAYAASKPIWEGLSLIKELSAVSRLVVAVGVTDSDRASFFLRTEGIKASVVPILKENATLDRWEAQWKIVERQRAQGPIDFVITSYGPVFQKCLISDQAALMFGSKGAFIGTEEIAPWTQIESEMDRRLEIKANDEEQKV
jgi:hypothetical protein